MFHGKLSVFPSPCSRYSSLISQLKLLIMLVAYCDFHSIHMSIHIYIYVNIYSLPQGACLPKILSKRQFRNNLR